MDFQKAFDAGFDAIKGYVDRSFATVFGRIKALEERAPERGEKGADGKDGAQGERGPEGPAGKDGRSAVKFLVDQGGELVGTFTDGTVERLGVVKGSDGKDGAPGRDGKDGSCVTVDDVLPTLKAHVDEFLAAIPAPANGKDGAQGPQGEKGVAGIPGERGPQGERGADGAQGERGPEGPAGKDGRSAVKFLVDQGGELVGTFTDGTVERLGVVKGSDGKDGAPGRDGKDGRDGIDGAPGTNGKDGADGFGFDDLDFEHDGARGFSFKFVRGDKVKTFSFTVPAMIYRGVYAATAEYERGDVVTFGGSTWHCNDNTADKPDGVNKAWTLVVKKGRDGKDGLAGEKGERGAEGRPGRDLTQLGADGAKW
jgi:hypothetical protein